MPKQIYVRSDDGAEMIEIAPNEYIAAKSALELGLISRADVETARKASDKSAASLSSYLEERTQHGEEV